MDKKIESYVEKIVSKLNCDKEEKREIMDEMRDHLLLLKNEYIEQGLTKEEATQKALKSFGEEEQLSKGLQESLFPFHKAFRIGTWILFCLYSSTILFMLLFQRIIVSSMNFINGFGWSGYVFIPPNSKGYFDIELWKQNSNIIPFKNTYEYITRFDHYNLDIIINNTLGSVLIFLPLGIFLPLLFKKYSRLSKVIVASFVISFSIEFLQLVLKVGRFDIEDVILNTVGSMVGFLLLKIMKSVLTIPKGSFFRRITN